MFDGQGNYKFVFGIECFYFWLLNCKDMWVTI